MDFLNLRQFSPSHIAIISFAIIFTAIFYFVFLKKQSKTKTIIAFIFGLLALFSVIGTNIYLALTLNNLTVFDYLPFLLSQASIILVLFACFIKSNKFKSIIFFIASFTAVYGLVVLDNALFQITTLSISTALYFLPYFFLLASSFMLVSNTKVKAANLFSACSLIIVFTAFAYLASLGFMYYFENAGLLNYFFTLFPRDFVMEYFFELLPFQFIYLAPMIVVFLLFSLITFALTHLFQSKKVTCPQQTLPKWELEEDDESIIKKKDTSITEKDDLYAEKTPAQQDSINETPAQQDSIKETPAQQENIVKEDIHEFDSINSYLDSFLPTIEENVVEDAPFIEKKNETVKEITNIEITTEENKPENIIITENKQEEPLDVNKQNVSISQAVEEKKEPSLQAKLDEYKIYTSAEEFQKDNKKAKGIESANNQENKKDDDKYTSFEDYDFMKELDDFKKVLNENDERTNNQNNLSPNSEVKKDAEIKVPEQQKIAGVKKPSNLDLLKALKNKVDKSNY